MTNPLWQGKTVVVVWEHKHIANAKVEAAYPSRRSRSASSCISIR
jgi:hypothetical protein